MQAASEVLAIGAHPDDVELTVGGTLLLARALGHRSVIVHMTAGESGTRGTPEIRRREAADAARALGAADMEILGLPDGHLEARDEMIAPVVAAIRRHRPRIVLAPYITDLHPDHEATGNIVRKAVFLAGLARWGAGGEPWHVERVLHYMSHTQVEPRILVDISAHLAAKRAAAECYRSQFFDETSTERQTYISGESFWHWWEARQAAWGNAIGARYAEAYWIDGAIATHNPFALFEGFGKYKNS
jgi:N-acetylglucosamine malate deacetylase 1